MRGRHNLAGWRGAQVAGWVLQHSAFDLPKTGDALLHQELVIVVECRAACSFVASRTRDTPTEMMALYVEAAQQRNASH